MVKLTEMTKDLKVSNADYVFDKSDKFLALLPYLTHKLVGDWYIVLVEPKLELVRNILDLNSIPEYVKLELLIEPSLLSQLMLERPSLAVKKLSVWETYQSMIAALDRIIDPKAVGEIYHRVGPNKEALREALELLCEKVQDRKIISKDVRLYISDNRRVYANQVVKAFLLKDKKRWDIFREYEYDLGTNIAFYAMRKYVRKLLNEKNKYLRNEDTKDRLVQEVDAFTINHAFYTFELANNPMQLIPVLHAIENRTDLLTSVR